VGDWAVPGAQPQEKLDANPGIHHRIRAHRSPSWHSIVVLSGVPALAGLKERRWRIEVKVISEVLSIIRHPRSIVYRLPLTHAGKT